MRHESTAGGFLWPTVDLLLAVAALGWLGYPLASSLGQIVGVDPQVVTLGTLVVALGGAYPFVADERWLGLLGEYLFGYTVAVIVVGLLGMATVVATGAAIAGSARWPQVLVFVAAHLLTAAWFGWLDGRR